MTNEDILGIVENEGLDYAIQHYLSPSDIEDPTLKEIWTKAKIYLDKVSAFLEDVEAELDSEEE